MPEPEAIPTDLPSRIVFSLLRGAVRLAARMGLPLKQVQQLVRLAYYQELREQHPRDRQTVADRLGVSLRTAAELGRVLKEGLTGPEEMLVFSRQVRQALDDQPADASELAERLGVEPERVAAVLETLEANGWTELVDGRWHVKHALQSFQGGSLPQKIDGLDRQQDVISDAAWAAFFGEPETPTTARSWVFHADPAAFATLRDQSIQDLRARMVELDEQSVQSADATRVGVTVVFSRMKQ